MKVKCYSVRLKSLYRISDKAFKATAFDGSSDIIPESQIFGIDPDVVLSTAYWISAWILEKKKLQYSTKKVSLFDYKKKHIAFKSVRQEYTKTQRHVPTEVNKEVKSIKELER